MKANGNIFRNAPLLRIALAVVLGILFGSSLGAQFPLWWSLSVSLLLVLLAVSARRFPLAESCLILLSVMSLGFFLAASAERRLARHFREGPVEYEAVLMSQPVEVGRIVRCDLLVVDSGEPFLLRASILRDTLEHRYRQLTVGDGLRAYSVLQPVSRRIGGGNFDFLNWAKAHHIVGQTFIPHDGWLKASVSLSQLSKTQRVRLSLLRFRQRLASQLDEVIADDDQRSVVAAMTLGDKSSLSRTLREHYSISGASHVLALSGLHLTILYALLSFLFRRFRWRRFAELLALVAVWFFALLVGFSPSVVRAATMLSVFTVMALLGRRAFSLNSLSLASIVMLVVNPLALWDVGFQLSFLAVLGILLFFRPIYRFLTAWLPQPEQPQNLVSRLSRWLLTFFPGLVATSIATQLTTAPLVAYHFGRFSCYFLLTNLVAIPLVIIILYLAFLFFALYFCRPLQLLVAKLITLFASWLNSSLEAIASWPGSSVENIHISALQTVLLYVLVGTLLAIFVVVRNVWLKNRLYRKQ